MKHALGLFLLGCALAACGGDDKSTGNHDDDCAPSNALKTVVNALTLPTDKKIGFDIDGDGVVDDRFAVITSALASQGFDAQSAVDTAVATGSAPILLEVDAGDATFANDTCTEVTLRIAAAAPAITFSGSDALTVSTAVTPVTFGGTITNNVFTSAAPSGTPQPINIVIGFAGVVAPIPLNAPHVQFTVDATAHTLKSGLIGGAVLVTDMNDLLFPALAVQLTAAIAAGGDTAASVSTLFDTGGDHASDCPHGCRDQTTQLCAEAGDDTVLGCEISSNSLLLAILAPDVALLDASGNVAPDHGRTPKDGLSYAVELTAVGATY